MHPFLICLYVSMDGSSHTQHIWDPLLSYSNENMQMCKNVAFKCLNVDLCSLSKLTEQSLRISQQRLHFLATTRTRVYKLQMSVYSWYLTTASLALSNIINISTGFLWRQLNCFCLKHCHIRTSSWLAVFDFKCK